MSAKITKSLLDAQPRTNPPTRIMDTELVGFGVQVGLRTVTFFVRRKVSGKAKHVTLGEYPVVTVAQARDLAREALARIALGDEIVPLRKRQKVSPTLGECMEAYLTKGRPLKPNTIIDCRMRIETHLADWLKKPIKDRTRKDCMERHAELTDSSGPSSANSVFRYFSAIWNWSSEYFGSEDEPAFGVCPVRGMRRLGNWNVERRRQTYVDASKMPDVMQAVLRIPDEQTRYIENAEVVRDLFLWIMFSGMRPGEASRIEVKDVDLQRAKFCLHDSKNGSDFYLPLTTPLLTIARRRVEYAQLCGSKYLFPASGKKAKTGDEAKKKTIGWHRQMKGLQADFPDMMLTNFRRTLTTVATQLDPPLAHMTVKRLLNHTQEIADGEDVTMGYYVTDVEALRVPAQRIADQVLAMAGISSIDGAAPIKAV